MAVAKKKPAKRKAAKKPTTRRKTAKKTTRKAATKKTTRKKVAKKTKRKTTAKKATSRTGARKTTRKAKPRKAASRTTTRRASTAKKKTTKKKSTTKRKPNAAFMRPMTLSPELGAVVGTKAIPRTEVTKQIWKYIKKYDLQDPKNRRNILADDKLKKLFGGKRSVSMFEMTKLISKHMK